MQFSLAINTMQAQCLQNCIILCLVFLILCSKRGRASGDEGGSINNCNKHSTYNKTTKGFQLSDGFDLTEEEIKKFKIWPEGVIPYFIDDHSFDKILKDKLRSLLGSFSSVTGLRFTELPGPPDNDDERWVFFVNRRGQLSCEDYTTKSFTNTGVQRVVLGYDCLDAGGGPLAPTVLALVGVPPQHNAPNRDKHIEVVMDNIMPDKRRLFEALKDNEWLFHDVNYDFISAGHYDFHKYTVNGSATIIPKKKTYLNVAVGEGDGISPADILKIKMLYNYINLKRKNAKSADCSQIFKPGPNFPDFKPQEQDSIIARPKPNKYQGRENCIEEPSYENGDKDGYSSGLNERNRYNSKPAVGKKNKLANTVGKSNKHRAASKDKLGDLQDFDTDMELKLKKRHKMSGKYQSSKQSKHKLSGHVMRPQKGGKSRLSMISDVDTDRDGGE